MSETMRVVLVDDHPLFRDGVAHTLRREPDIDVVGEGTTAQDALELCQQLLPDLLLLDINIPGGGLNAARDIAQVCPVVKIVMLTVSEEDEEVLAAFKIGVRGYVLKGVSARELVSMLRTVYAGEVYVTPQLAASLLLVMSETPRPSQETSNPLDELTQRERQILDLLATGRSNKEIGHQLRLREKTVKHHMTNILQKLQVRNRVEAALLAQQLQRPNHNL